MLVLLPPSETKRAGGDGAPLDLDALALPALRESRELVVDALIALSSDGDTAARVLKLSAKRRHEIADNASLRSSPTMPAVDRYTGVLYDALDAETLGVDARSWLRDHVLIHSAPLGPIGALDGIPAYRLAAGTSVPGLAPLRRVWSAAVTSAIADLAPTFTLDLRSEAYVGLGPVPAGGEGSYLRVVTESGAGAVRALNHFNKRAKGEFVRALASTTAEIHGRESLLSWAASTGWDVRDGDAGELRLFV